MKKKKNGRADDESKDEATEHDSAYESDGTDELREANDDKFNDDDAATHRVEPEAAPKSQTESKPKNKLIPESEPQPEAREIENSPASFGSYTCPTCDNEFLNKNPLNSHMLSMHTQNQNSPCEKCNRQVRWKNSFDEHIFGHQEPRKYNCTNCQKLVKMKRPHRKHELRIHVSEQKFYCEECGRTVEYRKSLKKHMRGHEEPMRPPLHCRAAGVANWNKKNDKTSDDDDAERKPPEPDENNKGHEKDW